MIWNVRAPGTTVWRVNPRNMPDKVKKLSNVVIPNAAKAPTTRDAGGGNPLCRCSSLAAGYAALVRGRGGGLLWWGTRTLGRRRKQV